MKAHPSSFRRSLAALSLQINATPGTGQVPVLFASGREVAINAEALPEWIQIAPFGEWPTRDKSAVQVFNAEAAAEMVAWFDFWPRKLARVMHINSMPVWVGHPDFAPDQWPERKQLGHVAALEARDDGLWGKVVWNAEASAAVAKHKFPSAAWDCEPVSEGRLKPVMLWSVGMWKSPNIKAVQPVVNACPECEAEIEDDKPEEGGGENLLGKIRAALMAVGLLKETDNENTVLAAVENAMSAIRWRREEEARQQALAAELKTALNATAPVELAPAVQRLCTLNAEAAQRVETQAREITALQQRVTELNAQRTALALDAAIEAGVITAAQRPQWEAQLNAAPSWDSEHAKLRALPPALHSRSVGDLGKHKPAITNATTRMTTINARVHELMESERLGYDAAVERSKADPVCMPLYEAMAEEQRQRAAQA